MSPRDVAKGHKRTIAPAALKDERGTPAEVVKKEKPQLGAGASNFGVERNITLMLHVTLIFNGFQDYAAFLGAMPGLGAGPALISIVLVVFMAFAGFLIVRYSTPLSKWASTAPSSGSNGRDIDR